MFQECLVWIDSSSKTILKTYLSGVDIPENGVSGGTVLVQDGLVKPTVRAQIIAHLIGRIVIVIKSLINCFFVQESVNSWMS